MGVPRSEVAADVRAKVLDGRLGRGAVRGAP